MEKSFALSFIILILILPTILAIEVTVEKVGGRDVIIPGLPDPAVIDLKIKNFGLQDNFEIYNSQGFNIVPKGTTTIAHYEEKVIELLIYPNDQIANRGYYNFQYIIKGGLDSSVQNEQLTIKILDLDQALEINGGDIDPQSTTIDVYVINKENFFFKDINIKFSSQFFEDYEKRFTLEPYEKRKFTFDINKQTSEKLTAGIYTIRADVFVGDLEKNIEGNVKFVEKNIVTTVSKNYGFFVSTKYIEKTNEGNMVENSDITIKKNIVSRLFTTFSPSPDIVNREGLTIYYTWEKAVNPGESLRISVKTNWFIPLIIIIFIILIVVLAKKLSATDLVLKKKVSFVKSKGGEFALKVSIIASAKNYMENVRIIDQLPPLVKLYERFGGEKPVRIDEKTKRVEWNFDRLDAGENRIVSYIVYSKVGVLGKFALPRATGIFDKEGKIKETYSNKAFFVAEQRSGDIEEY